MLNCMRVENKIAVVTGGSRGIGEAIALRLAQEGAKVLVTGRSQADLDQVVAKLNEIRPGCRSLVVDVLSETDIAQLSKFAFETFGTVDILVNNAGLYPVTPLEKLSLTEWKRVLDTNLTGAFLCAKAFAAGMVQKRAGGGRIVNISSTASLIARPGIAHYASSKAGLNMLTKVLAVELAPHSITVNAVCPGLIATRTILSTSEKPENQAEHKAKLQRIPLGRMGDPKEIASAVLFLVSDEAAYITGTTLFVDGGFSLGISNY